MMMSEIAKRTTSHQNYPQSNHTHATPFAIQTHSSLILVQMQDIPPASKKRQEAPRVHVAACHRWPTSTTTVHFFITLCQDHTGTACHHAFSSPPPLGGISNYSHSSFEGFDPGWVGNSWHIGHRTQVSVR